MEVQNHLYLIIYRLPDKVAVGDLLAWPSSAPETSWGKLILRPDMEDERIPPLSPHESHILKHLAAEFPSLELGPLTKLKVCRLVDVLYFYFLN